MRIKDFGSTCSVVGIGRVQGACPPEFGDCDRGWYSSAGVADWGATCPLTLSWSLFADPSVGHQTLAVPPLLIHTPSSQVTVGMTPSPGTCRWFLLSMGALSQFLAGSWVSRAWGVARVAWKQQHRVDPKGPHRRASEGQKRGESTWVATKGHLHREGIPGPLTLLGQLGLGGVLSHHQPPTLNRATELAVPGPGDPREAVQSLR